MTTTARIVSMCLFVASLSSAVHAADTPSEDIRAQVAAKVPPAKPEDVTLIAGGALYEVKMGARSVYVTADRKYMIAGDLFDLDTKVNMSDERRSSERKSAMQLIEDADAIVFGADGVAKHTITVFTDPDCTYCRQLHSQIEQINELGIEVRYLAYPRSGPGTESWKKSESIWCSKDRGNALTRAKRGEAVEPAECDSPVARNFKLGERVGVHGTPTILNEQGAIIGGYLSPQQLLQRLDGRKAPSAPRSK
jgi:thiol:disulfide interchange protein DsbC